MLPEDSLKGLLVHSLDALDRLDTAYSSMFLDAASVLRGWPTSDAMSVWQAWHGNSALLIFQQLQDRSLLEVDEKGCLFMHDVLVALGRSRLKEDKAVCGSRLWVEDKELVGYPEVCNLLDGPGCGSPSTSSLQAYLPMLYISASRCGCHMLTAARPHATEATNCMTTDHYLLSCLCAGCGGAQGVQGSRGPAG
jgi:hypothetical protein